MDAADQARLAIAFIALILSFSLAACHAHQDLDASPMASGFAMPAAAGRLSPPADDAPAYIGERFSAEQKRMADRPSEPPAPTF
jgi:hypothetical protein